MKKLNKLCALFNEYPPMVSKVNSFKKRAQFNELLFAVIGFNTEEEMSDFFVDQDTNMISCGVVFHNFDTKLIDFSLRFAFCPEQEDTSFNLAKIQDFTWVTERTFPLIQFPGPRSLAQPQGGPPDYENQGFLYMEYQLGKAIAVYLDNKTEESFRDLDVGIQRFPYPPYISDTLLFSLQFMLPFMVMLGCIYPTVNLTKSIVQEKEQRLEEAMRMMGLERWLHWTSWFINSFLWNLISVAINVALMCAPWKDGLSILTKSSPTVIFLFYISYWISCSCFSFLISTFFAKVSCSRLQHLTSPLFKGKPCWIVHCGRLFSGFCSILFNLHGLWVRISACISCC